MITERSTGSGAIASAINPLVSRPTTVASGPGSGAPIATGAPELVSHSASELSSFSPVASVEDGVLGRGVGRAGGDRCRLRAIAKSHPRRDPRVGSNSSARSRCQEGLLNDVGRNCYVTGRPGSDRVDSARVAVIERGERLRGSPAATRSRRDASVGVSLGWDTANAVIELSVLLLSCKYFASEILTSRLLLR